MLVKWQPFGSLIERDFFDDFFPVRTNTFDPKIDVRETDKSFIISAELPGMSKDDFKLTLEDNVLTLEGEKKYENEEKKDGYYRTERSYGAFKRSFRLTDAVNAAKMNADYSNGVLNIDIPKAAKAKPKQIEVKVN